MGDIAGFFTISTKGARGLQKRLNETAERLDRGEVGDKVRAAFINETWAVLHQLYTSEKADGDGLGDRGAGAEGKPFWVVDFLGYAEPGTFGELMVGSDHPYVLGYEFGTRDHPLNPHHPPEAMHFFSKGREWFIGDDKIFHAHVNPHNRAPALLRAVGELAQYGWHTAVWAILDDLNRPLSGE